MKRANSWGRNLSASVAGALVASAAMSACQSAPKNAAEPIALDAPATREKIARSIAESAAAVPLANTAYGKLMNRLALRNFGANLHAHHFVRAYDPREVAKRIQNEKDVETDPTTKRLAPLAPLRTDDLVGGNPCNVKGTFMMDDGRPCRDDGNIVGATLAPRANADGTPDMADYFRQACTYGTGEGDLDVLFITPHTKNNGEKEGALNTSTTEDQMRIRAAMLAELNPRQGRNPAHYCGMGQEASSISAGNHINIFGQFKYRNRDPKTIFFTTGDFPSLYQQIKTRNAAGEKLFLQMNHPGVKSDLWWKDMSEFSASKSRRKEGMNDYGLDDYAPVGCMIGKISGDVCKNVTATRLTPELLKQTYVNIRAAAGDPFRLIEVVPPGGKKEGEENEDGTEGKTKSFGATNNTMTTFPSVQNRQNADSIEEGVFDWVYYLSMGFKLAPTANQDNHHMNFGSATASRTGIVARDLNEASILDALNARRTFASEDRNAGVLLTLDNAQAKKIMGDALSTRASNGKFRIGYYDPDNADADARVRVYYYRANDVLDFTYGAETKKVFRTLGFRERNKAILPAIDAVDRSPNDLLPIKNGETIAINVPLVRGKQWIFVEVIQNGDLDKIWTAPIWVTRK